MPRTFDASRITKIGFDVDGTLYRKDVEYIPGHGSIQDSHDFWRFSIYERLKSGQSTTQVHQELLPRYQEAVRDGTLKNLVTSIPTHIKAEWAKLISGHGGSNGKALTHHFKTDPLFLHEMLSSIDFDFILASDPKLRNLIDGLKKRGYTLGILTTEVYETVEKVMKVLGLNIQDFSMNTGNSLPFFTTENVKDKKPGAEGFMKLVKAFGVEDPAEVVYVGDHEEKDIAGSLRCGLQAIHILNQDNDPEAYFANMEINGDSVEYAQVSKIHDVGNIIN